MHFSPSPIYLSRRTTPLHARIPSPSFANWNANEKDYLFSSVSYIAKTIFERILAMATNSDTCASVAKPIDLLQECIIENDYGEEQPLPQKEKDSTEDLLNTQAFRKLYLNKGEPFLFEKDMLACPFAQFDIWFKNVAALTGPKYEEVNAFALSTVSRDGRPSSRMLLLKGYGLEGFIFFTHSISRKGRELVANPYASGLFYWPRVARQPNRQVRIEGRVDILDERVAEEYWQKRPVGSRIGSKLSNQSSVIPGREYLEDKQKQLEELCKTDGETVITRPREWLGYALRPEYFEFWQGQSNRVHDRIVYEPNTQKNGWFMRRLAP